MEGEVKGDAQAPVLTLAQLGEPTDLTWEGTTDAVVFEAAARRDQPIDGVRGLGGGKPALRAGGRGDAEIWGGMRGDVWWEAHSFVKLVSPPTSVGRVPTRLFW